MLDNEGIVSNVYFVRMNEILSVGICVSTQLVYYNLVLGLETDFTLEIPLD